MKPKFVPLETDSFLTCREAGAKAAADPARARRAKVFMLVLVVM